MRFSAVFVLVLFLCSCAAPQTRQSAKQPAAAPEVRTAAPAAATPAPVSVAPAPVASLPSPETLRSGFAGLPWGVSASDVQGLVLVSEQPSLHSAAYVQEGGAKTFLGMPVEKIIYEFFEGALYQVWVEYPGVSPYEAITDALMAAYGPPSESKPQKSYHAWFLGDVNVYCAYHDDDGSGDVSFWNQPIYLKKEALVRSVKAQMQAAEETAASLPGAAPEAPQAQAAPETQAVQ